MESLIPPSRLIAPLLGLAMVSFAGCLDTDSAAYPYNGSYATTYPAGQPVYDANGQPTYAAGQTAYNQPVYINGQPVYPGQPGYPGQPVYSSPVQPGYPQAAYSSPVSMYTPGATGFAPDDYVYYPDDQVYFSPFRGEFFFHDGTHWEARRDPPRYFNRGDRSVHVRLPGGPQAHHDEIRRSYPGHGRGDHDRDDRDDRDDRR